MNHHPHILNAACNLLGICFIIIGSLKLADLNSRSYGDEAAWAAASLFFVSIMTSYSAVRINNKKEWQFLVADYAFIMGLVAFDGVHVCRRQLDMIRFSNQVAVLNALTMLGWHTLTSIMQLPAASVTRTIQARPSASHRALSEK